MNINRLTSFASLVTGEGQRLAYTYSIVQDNGELVSGNNKGSFVVFDAELQAHIDAIRDYIVQNKLQE